MSETLKINCTRHEKDFVKVETPIKDGHVYVIVSELGIENCARITKEDAIRLAKHLLKISAE